MKRQRKKFIVTPVHTANITFEFCCDELRNRYVEHPMIGENPRLIIIDEASDRAFAISANMLHDTEIDKVNEALWEDAIEKIDKCPFCGTRLFIL